MLRLISTIILCGVLCSTFIDYGANDCFFLLFPFAVSVGIAGLLAFALSVMKENSFRFTLSDGLITAGVTYYLIRYDYQLHLADWKVIYAALLLLLWYIARIIFPLRRYQRRWYRWELSESVVCWQVGGFYNFMVFAILTIFYIASPVRSSIPDLIRVICQCCFLSVCTVYCWLKVGNAIAGGEHLP